MASSLCSTLKHKQSSTQGQTCAAATVSIASDVPLSLLLPLCPAIVTAVAAHCQLHAEIEKLNNIMAALETAKRTLVKQAEMSGGLVDAMITSTTQPDLGMEQVGSVLSVKQSLLVVSCTVALIYCLCVRRSRCCHFQTSRVQ